MKALNHSGICRICGKHTELTPEHIPPKNAFNSSNVTVLPFSETVKVLGGANGRMPWDNQGLRGTIQQGGHKKYCLCRSCNNNTGQWYMRSYTDFVKTLHSMIVGSKLDVGSKYVFEIDELYPLRLYKAMMTLICDINNDCFGDENLRAFLLEKETKEIDLSKYSLYIYLVSSQMPRIWGLSGIVNIFNSKELIMVSEVASYPLGFALYIDKPNSYTPFGLNANVFATFDYYSKCRMRFQGMPYLDLNSHFPIDYRTKDEIISCIDDQKEDLDKNTGFSQS